MSKGAKIALISVAMVVAIIFSIYQFFVGTYNQMVRLDEQVKGQWAQVENQYQRRFDLIPNLVETVKGYASHESEVFKGIADARSRAGGVLNVSSEILENPESFQRFQQAQSELGGALQRLLAITENYPDLKANQNFLALQDQLEGTENRIAVERKRFNDVSQMFNVFIKQFPNIFIANMGGFREKQYFSATDGAAQAPQVSF
ncbi:MAG: LemA family protein [Treponemataceae bacterium]